MCTIYLISVCYRNESSRFPKRMVYRYKSPNLRFKFGTMHQVCFIFKRIRPNIPGTDMRGTAINNISSQYAEHMHCVQSATNNKCSSI